MLMYHNEILKALSEEISHQIKAKDLINIALPKKTKDGKRFHLLKQKQQKCKNYCIMSKNMKFLQRFARPPIIRQTEHEFDEFSKATTIKNQGC